MVRAEFFEMIRLENMEERGFGPEAMKRIKVCTKCGSSTSVEYDRCLKCGEALSEETVYDSYKSRHKYCTKCDTVVSAEKKYCPQCGEKL